MPSDQCCGTCKWWRAYRPLVGNCTMPMPDAVEHVSMESMAETEGTNCPCYERKGEDDGV